MLGDDAKTREVNRVQDLTDKLVWVVVIGGSLAVLIFVLVKVGEVIVKRRTAALLAKHEAEGGADEASPPPEE